MNESPDRASLAARLAAELEAEYVIEGEVGRGGMGVVFSARDLRLNRRVAIKVLPPDLAFREDIRTRFMREAQTAARLQHPHIVPIHAVGEVANMVYFVMGFVDGESLGQRLRRRGKLPVEEARRVMKETADALTMAHSQSVIHRDIKPDNILLEGTRRRVMVTDFGIAKAVSEAGTGLTGTGVAIGTPAYMSPEQAAGEGQIDSRSDIYSLGVVAYEMITGDPPFKAPTVPGILVKQITEAPPDILHRRPECPEELAASVLRCLEKDPDQRWPTAEALRRALDTRTSVPYRPHRSAPRRKSSGPPSHPVRRDPSRGRLDRSSRPSSRTSERRPSGARTSKSSELKKLDDFGEPRIVRNFRNQFASYVSVNGCLLLLNVLTGLDSPWFLFPAIGWGIGLASSYGRLWSAGYSWRDVIHRPPAKDSLGAVPVAGQLPRPAGVAAPPPSTGEFGKFAGPMRQMQSDRQAIAQIHEKLDPTERAMLPDLMQTVDRLYERAVSLGTTLQQMEGNFSSRSLEELDHRIGELKGAGAQIEPEADRQLKLLERQREALGELARRQSEVETQFESCVLAVQNVRFDMLRLRSAGVSTVLDDLTRATQQARALSIDINAAIGAAGEIREALGKQTLN